MSDVITDLLQVDLQRLGEDWETGLVLIRLPEIPQQQSRDLVLASLLWVGGDLIDCLRDTMKRWYISPCS